MKNYLKPCQYSIRLVEKLNSLDLKKDLDFELVNKAIYWAKKYHNGQFRKSGEPFYSHPLEVAYIISDHLLHTNTIVASILHDIVEDTEVTIGMILDEFGWRIAKIVDRLTRDRPDGTKLSVEEILSNAYNKKDKEVLLIKLIDRLHNIQTINALPRDKVKKAYKETLTNFLSLAVYFENKDIENIITEICYDPLKIKDESVKEFSMPIVLEDSYLLSLIFQNNLHLEESKYQGVS